MTRPSGMDDAMMCLLMASADATGVMPYLLRNERPITDRIDTLRFVLGDQKVARRTASPPRKGTPSSVPTSKRAKVKAGRKAAQRSRRKP